MSRQDYAYHGTLLEVKGVSQVLGGRPILRDVNLEVKDIRRPDKVTGQVVGLLGPSGIGKTRLFRILAGLDQPDTGTVLLGDEKKPVRAGMVGVVAQHYPLFSHRTVLGNLIVAGTQGGLTSDQAREKARGFLSRFGLEHQAGHYPAQLSGGQRQRVAIGQQYMCSEHFLLMDEPFSGLDPIAVDSVCELINEVANAHEFNTIIVVTHDITAALEVADTLWLIGRDRDAAGALIPGARVQETYNLMDRGLAWRDGITSSPEFLLALKEVRERFRTL